MSTNNDDEQFLLSGTMAQLLYLLNITFLPVVAFFFLLIIYFSSLSGMSPIAISHFRQALVASIVAGVLIILVSALILFLGGITSPYSWMLLILYVTCVHSYLILIGVFALTRAQAGKTYDYPVIARFMR